MTTLSDEELGRLIHLRHELTNMVAEWKAHGWGPGLAARFKAMSKLLANEPAPSPAFKNLAQRQSMMTAEQCQTMINGALLALTHKAGGRLVVPVHDIFDAHAALSGSPR